MIVCLLVFLIAAQATASESPDRPGGSTAYAEALARYRAGEIEVAASILERRIAGGEVSAAHHTLLGWCRLRLDQLDQAASAFGAARKLDPRSAEAWKGSGLARERAGDPVGARKAFARAVELAPDDEKSRELLERNLRRPVEERRLRAPRSGSEPLTVVARTREGRIEVRNGPGFRPIFVKGVNLGTALPGAFPAGFPDDEALYRRWFEQIGELGANVVRLYTLHPPSLYRALHAHNRERPARKLWLVQGVWSELPPGDDYDGAEFAEGFHAEIRRVIDAVHGNLELPPRPGRAHGIYDVDLSADVLAYLLGREWEPFSVVAYNELRAEQDRFEGRYVRTGTVQPFEAWLASILEVTVAHETETYRVQRPASYVSWPTLDPLIHPTEATLAEEQRLRAAGDTPASHTIKEYENDRVQIDSTRLLATDAFPAGLFASYHVYPYYPEFMILDPDYGRVHDEQGISRYLGYLRALRRHHGDQPVLVAEFGVPSSRGIAHLHPEGQHHGGHDERAQGEIDARLLRNIHQAGLAGGILFAWMDEWFKRNWLVMNFEAPAHRNPLWLNAQDPEQNFGLLATRPGEAGPPVVLDGRGEDWADVAPLYEREEDDAVAPGGIRRFRVTQDSAYLYLGIEVSRAHAPREYWIGIDTYDAKRGDRRFPPPVDRVVPPGMEFLIQLAGPEESRIRVARPYDLFARRYRRPYRSEPSDEGDFVEIRVETNRDRFSRDGTHHTAKGYSRSPLRRGTTDSTSPDYDSLADWFASADGTLIEARIPWGLINVTDPSSHQVVHEADNDDGIVETVTTEGFRFHLLVLSPGPGKVRIIDSLPEDPRTSADYPVFEWPAWETPTYLTEPKRSYFILQETMQNLPD